MGFIREQYFKNKNAIDQEAATWRAEQQRKGPQAGSVPSWANMPSVQPSRHHMADLQRQADDYNAQVRNYQRQQAAYQTYQDRMGMDVEQGKKELVLRDQEMTERQTMIDVLNAQDWAKQNGAIQQHIAQLEAEQANEKASTNNLRSRVSEAEALQTAKAPMTATEARANIEKRDSAIVDYERLSEELKQAQQQQVAYSRDPYSTPEQRQTANDKVVELTEAVSNAKKAMQESYAVSDESEYVAARDRQLSDPRYDAYYTHARTTQNDLEKVQAVNHYLQYGSGDPKKVLEEYIPYISEKYGLSGGDITAQSLTALYDQLKGLRDRDIDLLTAAGYDYDRMAEYEAQQERNAKMAEEIAFLQEQARTNPVYSSLASIGDNLAAGGDFIGSWLMSMGRNDPTDPTTYRTPQKTDYENTAYVNAVRDTVANDVIDTGFGRFLYQTGMSMADSLAALGVSSVAGIPKAATVLMGMSAAGHAAKDIVDRGGTSQQAFWGGLTAGAMEALMEKVPLDQLLNIGSVDSLKAMLKGVLKQGATEAGEEMLTEIANNIFDGFIMGDKSNYNLTVRQLMDDDPLLTKEEAQRDAAMKQVEQVAMAGLGGFVSGLGFGGAANVGSYVANRGQRTDIDLLDGLVQPQPQQNTLPVETDLDRAMMETIGQNNTDISLDMPEAQRYERLTTKTITVTKKDASTINAELQGNIESIKTSAAKAARNTIVEIARKIGLLNKPLTTPTIDFEFDFSKRNGLRESLTKQMRYGGNYASMAGAVANLETILKNAVLIEQHTDKYKGTIRENPHLLRTCVLLGVYEDGTDIIPVQFEIKETDDTGGHLYIVVSLTKIEAGVFGSTQSNNSTARGLLPASTYSLSDIFANVNVADKHFLKYVPDGFLSEEQKMAKQEALEEDRIRISKIPKKEATPAKEPVNGNNLQYPAEGFVGAYSGMTYNAEQAALLAAVSTEGIQVAEELATRQDVTFNNIGINDKETQQKWLDAGLAYVEQNADGDSFLVVNAAMLLDERARRANAQKQSNSQNNQENDLSFLYDIDPIKMVGRPGKSGATPTTHSISQTNQKSNSQNNSSNGQNSVTETETFRVARAKELMDKYGTIYPGENPHRKARVPRKTSGKEFVSQTIRTVIEAKATPDADVPTLEELAADGEFSYERYTDQQAMDDARDTITHLGYQGALTSWTNAVERGKVSKKNTALGWELYRQAANANDMESAVTILNLMVEHQRNAAQALQATRILKKMDPDAQLYGVQKSVSKLQEELKAKFKNKAPELKISTALAEQFLNAETDEARAKALNAMYADIGRQIPSTFKEKWDNWRYLAMLANPRTHIRNFFGNAAFMPVRGIGNQLSALGQLTLPKEQRTRSLFFNVSKNRRALLDAAKADFDANAGELVMSGEKYNSATNIIDKNKRVFQFKPLEAARKGNGNLLEWEDKIFSKQAYSSALAGYLNAKGYTAEDFTGDGMTQQQKDDARSFAIKEAQKATYRDANAFSDLVTSIGFKKPKNGLESGINALVEGVLPFKKTPANILVRAFEYSPAGVVAEGVRATVDGVKNKNFDAVRFIDNMSKGLTGSAVFALGMLLAKWGVIEASPEDEEQSELEGRQTYSLEIGGKSITLDWAAPGVIPLFMGVELKNAIDELTAGESISLADIADVFSALTGPMENMSMLDGLNSTIESAAIASQNDQRAIDSVVGTAALNYFTQAFPTIFGQIERAIAKNEWVRQTTFIDKESEIPTGLQYTLGRVGNKIPGFDFAQVPYVDAWGRTQDNGNVAVRAANNMLNPSYISDIEETDVDREIKRLEEATGENFTPSRVKNNKLSVDGKTVFLTEDEFFTYATAKGQNDLIFRESLMNDPRYETLDDATKGKLQNASEAYAKVLAMQEAGLKPELSEWQEELQDADIQTITDKLISNAVEARAKSKGKELGGGKYDGLAWLYDEGQIDDEMAISEMSNTMQTAYGNFSDNGTAFTADEMIDVYAYANKVDGTSADKLDAAVEYIRKEWPNDSKKALALFDAMEATLTYSMTRENEVDAKARAAYGSEGQRAIFEQMTDSQQSNYGKYVKHSGVTAYEFELALKYKSEHKKDEVKAYLERCGYTYAQQQAILNGLYKQK